MAGTALGPKSTHRHDLAWELVTSWTHPGKLPQWQVYSQVPYAERTLVGSFPHAVSALPHKWLNWRQGMVVPIWDKFSNLQTILDKFKRMEPTSESLFHTVLKL